MLTRIRRGLAQKKNGGGEINKAEKYKGESFASTEMAQSSGRTPEDYKGKGSPIKKSKSKAGVETNSSMLTYSFADYCDPSPAVVLTRCEDEANKLVQTLEGYAHRCSLSQNNNIHP